MRYLRGVHTRHIGAQCGKAPDKSCSGLLYRRQIVTATYGKLPLLGKDSPRLQHAVIAQNQCRVGQHLRPDRILRACGARRFDEMPDARFNRVIGDQLEQFHLI